MSRTVTPVLAGLNGMAFSVVLTQIDATTGAESNLTTGTLTGFVSIGYTYAAAALAGAGTFTGTYSGADGAWTVTKAAGDATEAGILNTAGVANDNVLYAVLTHSSGRRFYVELEYQAGVAAIITT